MGIPFTLPMGFLLTIALAIQLTISNMILREHMGGWGRVQAPGHPLL